MRREKRRDNVVAKIQKAQNLGVPWRAYQLYLYSGKETLAATYPRRVRVVDRAAMGGVTRIDGLYLASIEVDAASIRKNKKKEFGREEMGGMAAIPPRRS